MNVWARRFMTGAVVIPTVFSALKYFECAMLIWFPVMYYGLKEYCNIVRIILTSETNKEYAKYIDSFTITPISFIIVTTIPIINILLKWNDMLEYGFVTMGGGLILTFLGITWNRVLIFNRESANQKITEAIERMNIITLQFWAFELFYVLAVVIPMSHNQMMYLLPSGGGNLLIWFTAAWQCDNGCLFLGKLIGKHKCTPYISPGKTWEGALGGYLLCAFSLWIYSWFANMWIIPNIHGWHVLGITAVAATASIVGDMGESFLKRGSRLKDSGDFFPGHGGMLDRIDSIALSCPAVYYYLRFFPL